MNRLLALLFAFSCVASAAGAQGIVINEAVYDSPSTDVNCWLELRGPGGTSLNGYRVIGIDGNGCTPYNPIPLDGYVIPADGYFVIAQTTATIPNVDVYNDAVNYQNGPDNIQLQQNVGGNWVVVDAVCYESCTGSCCFAGETTFCVGQTPPNSMARCPDGRDTGDNSADFIQDANPTPGTTNMGTCAPPPPTDRTICEVAADDPVTGRPALENQYVRVHGLALTRGDQWQVGNIEFMITDGQCCVDVFKAGVTTPFVQEGDQVTIVGTVSFYNGKTELSDPNLVITIDSSGSPLPDPGQITSNELAVNGEVYESCLIKIRCVTIVGGDPWPADGINANITVDDGTGPTIMRIDKDTDIDGSPAPPPGLAFTVIGIGTQFDSSAPYWEGYQIQPRRLADLLFQDCLPPMGACCTLERGCAITTAEECAQAGGLYMGDNTTCDPNPCLALPGACCFPDGTCQVLSLEACGMQGGSYQGYNTTCDPNPCRQPEMACCFPDGRCEFVIETECLDLGGVPQGHGTVCDPNPCEQPPMACCYPDGHCEYVTAEVCTLTGGAPQGYGTVCDPNPCPQPPMACCFPDGRCAYVTEVDCLAMGGVPQGYGTNCEPNLCEQPPQTGACCIGDQGQCEVMTAEECGAQGGVYQGDNVPCDPNPCPIVPVRSTTWGQIKANYR